MKPLLGKNTATGTGKRGNPEEESNYLEISELNDLIEREGLEEYLYIGGVEELY